MFIISKRERYTSNDYRP